MKIPRTRNLGLKRTSNCFVGNVKDRGIARHAGAPSMSWVCQTNGPSGGLFRPRNRLFGGEWPRPLPLNNFWLVSMYFYLSGQRVGKTGRAINGTFVNFAASDGQSSGCGSIKLNETPQRVSRDYFMCSGFNLQRLQAHPILTAQAASKISKRIKSFDAKTIPSYRSPKIRVQ